MPPVTLVPVGLLAPNTIASSSIFACRNYDKGENGHAVRYAVAMGQGKKIIDAFKYYDNLVGDTAQTANALLQNAANESVFLKGCGKLANFASKNINPLIVASGVYDVFMSDNKMDKGIVTATALGTMFTGENLMKKYSKNIPKIKFLKGITNKVNNFAKSSNKAGWIIAILQGSLFVVGSCLSYFIGDKLGNKIVNFKNQ